MQSLSISMCCKKEKKSTLYKKKKIIRICFTWSRCLDFEIFVNKYSTIALSEKKDNYEVNPTIFKVEFKLVTSVKLQKGQQTP